MKELQVFILIKFYTLCAESLRYHSWKTDKKIILIWLNQNISINSIKYSALTFCLQKEVMKPSAKESPTQESITTDEVKYDDLGYIEGIFTLEDKPFNMYFRTKFQWKTVKRAINLLMGFDGIIETKERTKECIQNV